VRQCHETCATAVPNAAFDNVAREAFAIDLEYGVIGVEQSTHTQHRIGQYSKDVHHFAWSAPALSGHRVKVTR
jgi:hypothetical protein